LLYILIYFTFNQFSKVSIDLAAAALLELEFLKAVDDQQYLFEKECVRCYNYQSIVNLINVQRCALIWQQQHFWSRNS
jgi:hypothetical protein